MKILTRDELDNKLFEYYEANYGKRETDRLCERSAVNVFLFIRDDKLITLKSHILTGEVTEYIFDVCNYGTEG